MTFRISKKKVVDTITWLVSTCWNRSFHMDETNCSIYMEPSVSLLWTKSFQRIETDLFSRPKRSLLYL